MPLTKWNIRQVGERWIHTYAATETIETYKKYKETDIAIGHV